jgi:hypothetical protein
MGMNDVRAFTGMLHKLQCGFGEEGKSNMLIGEAIIAPTLEKVVIRMWFYEETLTAMDEAEPDSATYMVVVPGNP